MRDKDKLAGLKRYAYSSNGINTEVETSVLRELIDVATLWHLEKEHAELRRAHYMRNPPKIEIDNPWLRAISDAWCAKGTRRMKEDPKGALQDLLAEVHAAGRAAGIEASAKVCDQQAGEPECPERAQYCADAIRAKKKEVNVFAATGAPNASDIIDRLRARPEDAEGTSPAAEKAGGLSEPCAPAILEALSYHERERDDLTLEDAVKAFRFGYKEVRQRDDRTMLAQLIHLMASAPDSPTAADAGGLPVGVCFSEQRCEFYAADTGVFMGRAFYDQWRDRADDFPDRATARAQLRPTAVMAGGLSERKACPTCNDARVIGTPGAPCPFCTGPLAERFTKLNGEVGDRAAAMGAGDLSTEISALKPSTPSVYAPVQGAAYRHGYKDAIATAAKLAARPTANGAAGQKDGAA